MSSQRENIIAIVGRPNVGKSTLFNRLVGTRLAIESPISGTTRDRIFGEATWQGRTLFLVDLAGVETGVKTEIDREVQASVDTAIENADLVIFVVDWTDKNNDKDKAIARRLRASGKKIVLAVNKSDNIDRIKDIEEFRRLGFDKMFAVSAISGKNIGDFLDSIIEELPVAEKIEEDHKDVLKISILGRPNVGKSTLINTIIGEKRAVVSEVPGTTRDSIEVDFNFKGTAIKIVDTAGIRRRGKIEKDTIESFSVLRTYRALRDSDIAILVIDAVEGLVANDMHILGLAKEWGKGIILAVNKIDEKEDLNTYMATELFSLQTKLNFTPWLPVVFISAKENENVNALLGQILKVRENRKTIISQDHLDQIFQFAKETSSQMQYVLSIKQDRANPPTFKVRYKGKEPHQTVLRFLENKIRDVFPMEGSPIFIDLVPVSKKK